MTPRDFYRDLMDTPAGTSVARASRYLSAELPQTATEFIHRLAELGYLIRESEYLSLQDTGAHDIAGDGLNGHGLDTGPVAERVSPHVVLNVHLTTSCDARTAGTAGITITVEGPADISSADLARAVHACLLGQARPAQGKGPAV